MSVAQRSLCRGGEDPLTEDSRRVAEDCVSSEVLRRHLRPGHGAGGDVGDVFVSRRENLLRGSFHTPTVTGF